MDTEWYNLQSSQLQLIKGLARLRLDVSLTALNKFLLNDLNMYWPYVWYVDEAKTHSLQDL